MSDETTNNPIPEDEGHTAPVAEPAAEAGVMTAAADGAACDAGNLALRTEHEVAERPSPARAVAVALAGWIVPGLGHVLLKMWGRALAIFLTVGFLVYLGAGMRGNIFAAGGEDAFSRLGYLADLGAGSFYYAARAVEVTGSDVSHSDGDYGTRFLATAGVLNLLAALHAYEAARGRKA